MAVVVDRDLSPAQPLAALGSHGWLAVAGGASLGAGAIHAAAIGVHNEHREAAIVFTAVAAVQLAWGALLLVRSSRLLRAAGALATMGVLGGWILAKTTGIGAIAGLEEAEAVQTADGFAAGLAAVALLAVLAHSAGLGRLAVARSPLLTGGTAVLVAALAVPGMLSAGTHSHEGGHGHGDGGHETTAAGHDEGDAHEADAAAHDVAGDDHAVSVPPRPFDPALPIDLGGVPGVSLEEQARAENLLAVTLLRLPQFADPLAVEAMGFHSIGDGFTGHEHYLHSENMRDDRILDPDHPEALVYDTSTTPKRLVAAMYMLDAGDTLDDVPELGGALTQWHVHDNLCFDSSGRVAGLTNFEGGCSAGLVKGTETPMIHVWIEPHPCGPFAALEGVAGGTVPAGEARLCDHAHGA